MPFYKPQKKIEGHVYSLKERNGSYLILVKCPNEPVPLAVTLRFKSLEDYFCKLFGVDSFILDKRRELPLFLEGSRLTCFCGESNGTYFVNRFFVSPPQLCDKNELIETWINGFQKWVNSYNLSEDENGVPLEKNTPYAENLIKYCHELVLYNKDEGHVSRKWNTKTVFQKLVELDAIEKLDVRFDILTSVFDCMQLYEKIKSDMERKDCHVLTDADIISIISQFEYNEIINPIESYFNFSHDGYYKTSRVRDIKNPYDVKILNKGRSMQIGDEDGNHKSLNLRIVDKLAQLYDIDLDDRVEFNILIVLTDFMMNGHSCMPQDDLLMRLSDEILPRLKLEQRSQFKRMLDKQIFELIDDSPYFIRYSLGDDHIPPYIYKVSAWYKERSIARFVYEEGQAMKPFLRSTKEYLHNVNQKTYDLKEVDNVLFSGMDIQYTKEQWKAIREIMDILKLAHGGLYILNGLPGTGKSFVVNVLTCIANNMGKNICLCAPTGKAALRMGDEKIKDTSKDKPIKGQTIHKALYKPNKGDDRESNIEKCDFLVIDEVSMLDVELAYQVFRQCDNTSCQDRMIILVGDPNQLPSIGYGDVLKSILRTNMIPNTFLCEVKRQQKGSAISLLAKWVIEDNTDSFKTYMDSLNGLEMTNNEVVSKLLDNNYRDCESERVKIIHDQLLELYSIYRDRCFIISPYRKKANRLGTDVINELIHDKFFAKNCEPGNNYAMDERVMVTKNIYQKKEKEKEKSKNKEKGKGKSKKKRKGDEEVEEPPNGFNEMNNDDVNLCCTSGVKNLITSSLATAYNGETGKFISSYLGKSTESLINFHYDGENKEKVIENTSLSYGHASTVHKMQGSDHPIVIIIVDRMHANMLNKELLYTAITRAKDKLYILGEESGMNIAKHTNAPDRIELLSHHVTLFSYYSL